MSAYTSSAQDDVRAMIAQVKSLTVEKLKNLLRAESLPVSGIKSELQSRTISRTSASAQPLSRLFGLALTSGHGRHRQTS
jgi:hypothetical protein